MDTQESFLPSAGGLPIDPSQIKARRALYVVILKFVCEEFKISDDDLKSPSRKRTIARPRQVLMYLACMDTMCSTIWIGRRLGNRDHTTVMHGRNTIHRMMENKNDRECIASHVLAIRARYTENP